LTPLHQAVNQETAQIERTKNGKQPYSAVFPPFFAAKIARRVNTKRPARNSKSRWLPERHTQPRTQE
jgi:hypothetical protein